MKNLSLITVINSNPYLLFRPEEKINEGDKEHPLFMKVLETFEGEIIR